MSHFGVLFSLPVPSPTRRSSPFRISLSSWRRTTLSTADAQALAARFLSLHTTSRPDVAFALLRVLSVLRPVLGDTAVSLRGDYVNGKVRVTVTDVLAQPRSDVIVLMREGTEEPLHLVFEKDAFVASATLSQGVHSFVVKVGGGEGLHGRCRA